MSSPIVQHRPSFRTVHAPAVGDTRTVQAPHAPAQRSVVVGRYRCDAAAASWWWSPEMFVLHGLAPIQHGLHHANPDEAVLTISWQIWVCFLLTYLVAGGTFVAGALIAYAWYLFVHHCSHHSPDSLSLTLIGHHRNHHRFATRNFGVSTTFWDHIFGTTLDGVPAKK